MHGRRKKKAGSKGRRAVEERATWRTVSVRNMRERD